MTKNYTWNFFLDKISTIVSKIKYPISYHSFTWRIKNMKIPLHTLLPLPVLYPHGWHPRVSGGQPDMGPDGRSGVRRMSTCTDSPAWSVCTKGQGLARASGWKIASLMVAAWHWLSEPEKGKEGIHAKRQSGMWYQSPRGEAGGALTARLVTRTGSQIGHRRRRGLTNTERRITTNLSKCGIGIGCISVKSQISIYTVRCRNKYKLCTCVFFYVYMCMSV